MENSRISYFPRVLKIAAMGPKTAKLGRDEGLNIDFVPEAERLGSEGLLVSLLRQGERHGTEKVPGLPY